MHSIFIRSRSYCTQYSYVHGYIFFIQYSYIQDGISLEIVFLEFSTHTFMMVLHSYIHGCNF